MKRMGFLMLAVAAVSLLAGCEKKFTEKRFDTLILSGQSKVEVEKILGKPNARWSRSWKWVDFDEGYSGKVLFDENGRVVGKKFTSMHRDDADPETQWTEEDGPVSAPKPAPAGGTTVKQETIVTP